MLPCRGHYCPWLQRLQKPAPPSSRRSHSARLLPAQKTLRVRGAGSFLGGMITGAMSSLAELGHSHCPPCTGASGAWCKCISRHVNAACLEVGHGCLSTLAASCCFCWPSLHP